MASSDDQESLITLPGGRSSQEEEDNDTTSEGPPEVETRQPARARCPVTVEPLLVIYFVGLAMYKPLTQQLLYIKVQDVYNVSTALGQNESCVLNQSDPAVQEEQRIQGIAATWLIGVDVVGVAPALFMTLYMGSLSDRVGRKVAILVPLIGSVFRGLWFLLVLKLRIPLWTVLLGPLVDGCCGGPGVITMACFAMIADVTSREKRAVRIIIVEVCQAFGLAGSNIATGYIIQYLGYANSYGLTAGIFFIAFLYAWFGIPETVNTRETAKQPKVSMCAPVAKSVRLFIHDNGTGRRHLLWLIIGILGIVFMAETGSLDALTLTLLGAPLCWTSVKVGYFLASVVLFRNFGSMVTGIVLVRRVSHALLLAMACMSAVAYFIILSIAQTTLVMYMGNYLIFLYPFCVCLMTQTSINNIWNGFNLHLF